MPINAELTFSSHSFCTNNLQFFHLFSGVMVDDFGSNYFIRFKNFVVADCLCCNVVVCARSWSRVSDVGTTYHNTIRLVITSNTPHCNYNLSTPNITIINTHNWKWGHLISGSAMGEELNWWSFAQRSILVAIILDVGSVQEVVECRDMIELDQLRML